MCSVPPIAVGLAFKEKCAPHPDIVKFFSGEDNDEEDVDDAVRKMATVGVRGTTLKLCMIQ